MAAFAGDVRKGVPSPPALDTVSRAARMLNGRRLSSFEFDLEDDDSEKIVNGSGKQLKAVTLQAFAARHKTKSSKHTTKIVAYYIPFDANNAFHHRLVEDVDFCFTDTLNGCTFVVDSNAQTPYISHYNYQTNTGGIDQGKIDRHIQRRYNAPTRQVGGVIRRDDYKTGNALDYKVTIIGVRANGRWRFYYQRRQQDLIHIQDKGSSYQTVALDMRVTLV